MMELVQSKQAEIVRVCERFSVRRLSLFGSAASRRFDPETSDLDFVVDLGEYDRNVADRFLDLADALEALFNRPVDLITEASIVNPYFREAVEESRIVLYEARDPQAVA